MLIDLSDVGRQRAAARQQDPGGAPDRRSILAPDLPMLSSTGAVRAGAVQSAGQCGEICARRLADHDRARGATAAMWSCRCSTRATGIPPRDLERIFDKFYRVHARGPAARGHGPRPRDLPRLRRGDGRHASRRPTAPTAAAPSSRSPAGSADAAAADGDDRMTEAAAPLDPDRR